MIGELVLSQVREQQLGNYRLIRLLGQGSFSKVYLGEHLSLNTQAAVKVLRAPVELDEVQRFQTEALLMAHLKHPSIVRVLDFGVKEHHPFLILEYAPNGTLRQYLPQGVPQPLRDILPSLLQLTDALQYIHDHNVIHCDIKPENLLLGLGNDIWLCDFGSALVIEQGGQQYAHELRGTAAYMAPEQTRGRAFPASDQYALAVLMYEWLCGERPFTGSPLQVCLRHVQASPPPLRQRVPSISPAVESIVLKALAKEPEHRFAQVQEFAQALQQAQQEEDPVVLVASY